MNEAMWDVRRPPHQFNAHWKAFLRILHFFNLGVDSMQKVYIAKILPSLSCFSEKRGFPIDGTILWEDLKTIAPLRESF